MSKKSVNRYNLVTITGQFDTYLSQKNLSKISRKNYLSDIRFFLDWLHIQEDVPEFTVDTVISYKFFLQNSRLPVRSINRALSSIRAYGDLLVHNRQLFTNPARLVANLPTHPTHIQHTLIQEFSQTSNLSVEDKQALYEFLKLNHEST